MLDILATTSPIYLAIAVGYLATRWGLFNKTELRVLGKFVINVALPAMLLNALIHRRAAEILNVTYVSGYAAGSLITIGAAFLWARRLAPADAGARPYIAMGMSCVNSGFVGFPIMLLALPSVADIALAMNMLVENILLIPLLLSLAERGGGVSGASRLGTIGRSIWRLRKNPLIVAIFVAFALSLMGVKLPAPMERTIALFAQSSIAVALFVIGGTLYGMPVKGISGRVFSITAGKLLLHPLLVGITLFAAVALGLPPCRLRCETR